jgi:hypothetical protein
LGVWEGTYSRDNRPWLRWYDAEENWIPTIEELKQQAEEREQVERQGRLEAEQRATLLAERLKALGIDPDIL